MRITRVIGPHHKAGQNCHGPKEETPQSRGSHDCSDADTMQFNDGVITMRDVEVTTIKVMGARDRDKLFGRWWPPRHVRHPTEAGTVNVLAPMTNQPTSLRRGTFRGSVET